ncbi:MAG: hypothetical protein ACE5IK_04670 [Acidobacteriota bacterium]
MNNPTKLNVHRGAPRVAAAAVAGAPETHKATRPYEPPTIQTFSGEQILQEVGPAQGYVGTIPGVGGTGL